MAFGELARSSPSSSRSISRPLTAQPHPNWSMTIPNFFARKALSKGIIIVHERVKDLLSFRDVLIVQSEHHPMNAFIGSAGRAISSVLEKSTIEFK